VRIKGQQASAVRDLGGPQAGGIKGLLMIAPMQRHSLALPRIAAALASVGMITVFAVAAGVGGCASDEPVGKSTTTTKKTVETPDEKITVTETKKKETTVNPR